MIPGKKLKSRTQSEIKIAGITAFAGYSQSRFKI
jgi:hypothetical protein